MKKTYGFVVKKVENGLVDISLPTCVIDSSPNCLRYLFWEYILKEDSYFRVYRLNESQLITRNGYELKEGDVAKGIFVDFDNLVVLDVHNARDKTDKEKEIRFVVHAIQEKKIDIWVSNGIMRELSCSKMRLSAYSVPLSQVEFRGSYHPEEGDYATGKIVEEKKLMLTDIHQLRYSV